MPTHAAYHFNSSVQRIIDISDRCHVRFATMVDKKHGARDDRVHMNQFENCQARYRSNTWMGRTCTASPDEFEPSKFDCIYVS